MIKYIKYIIPLCLILISSPALATTLISEDFDDQAFTSPLNMYYSYGAGITYSTTQRYGGTGYSIEIDHVQGDVMAILTGFQNYLNDGVYFRYWVYYPTNYYWPGEEALFENVKMFKLAGSLGWDIEFIYKDSSGGNGATTLQLVWNTESTTNFNGGTSTGSTTLGSALDNDQWHKVEIYIKIPDVGNSVLHVQVDDYDVYNCTNCDIRKYDSNYTNTQQFSSIRGSNAPSAGHGVWYFDQVTVVYNEGDLTGSEPAEPGAGDSTPPTISAASANGTTISITTDETTVWTGYDANDCNLDGQYHTDNGLSSPSGSGTSWTLTAQYPITAGETVNLDCTLGTDDIEDSAGNDMVTFADTNVTNNTAQSPQVSGISGYGVQAR